MIILAGKEYTPEQFVAVIKRIMESTKRYQNLTREDWVWWERK